MKQSIAYPRIAKRMQAFLADGVILGVGIIVTLIIISNLGVQGVESVIMAGLAVILLEPALVSFTGGTIGHHILGLRVVKNNTKQNLTFFSALIRFVIKVLLGFYSIVTLFTTKQYQAIHDLLIGSIVILKNPQTLNEYEVLAEQEVERPGYTYPTKARRIVMSILYNIALFIILQSLLALFLSEKCFDNQQCLVIENLFAYSLSILWLIGFFVCIIFCWRGLLFGCQRVLNKAG